MNEIGRCNICGKEGLLSKDHVPPQALSNHSQKRFEKGLGILPEDALKKPFSYKARNGITFQTICKECNSMLGGCYDKELILLGNIVRQEMFEKEEKEIVVNVRPNIVLAHPN